MNVITIFILLFLLTISVKGTHGNNTFQSEEENLNSTNSELLLPDYLWTEDTNNTSASINTTGTWGPTKSPDIQNPIKCENKSVSYHPADTDTNTEKQSDLKLDLKTIFIFLLGAVCSTVILSTVLCFVAICKRCRATNTKTDNPSVILEAVISEHDQADEHDPLQVKTPAGVSTNSTRFDNGTEEKTETEQTEVNEVNYATINYSLLPQKDDGDLKPQKVESDYAEIQIKKPNKDEKKQTLQDEVKQDELTQSQEGGMES